MVQVLVRWTWSRPRCRRVSGRTYTNEYYSNHWIYNDEESLNIILIIENVLWAFTIHLLITRTTDITLVQGLKTFTNSLHSSHTHADIHTQSIASTEIRHRHIISGYIVGIKIILEMMILIIIPNKTVALNNSLYQPCRINFLVHSVLPEF